MKIVLFLLMIRLIIRLAFKESDAEAVAGTDAEITIRIFDPASFQLREECDNRI